MYIIFSEFTKEQENIPIFGIHNHSFELADAEKNSFDFEDTNTFGTIQPSTSIKRGVSACCKNHNF